MAIELLDEVRLGTPNVAKSGWVTLVDDVTAAASGAYTYTSIFRTVNARFLHLYVEVDAAAAGNQIGLLVVGTAQETLPLSGDDVWFPLAIWNSVVTSTALGGARPSGADYTATPNWGQITPQGLLLTTPAASGATDEIRLAEPPINLGGCRFIQIAWAEHGNTGTPSNLRLRYNLSI